MIYAEWKKRSREADSHFDEFGKEFLQRMLGDEYATTVNQEVTKLSYLGAFDDDTRQVLPTSSADEGMARRQLNSPAPRTGEKNAARDELETREWKADAALLDVQPLLRKKSQDGHVPPSEMMRRFLSS